MCGMSSSVLEALQVVSMYALQICIWVLLLDALRSPTDGGQQLGNAPGVLEPMWQGLKPLMCILPCIAILVAIGHEDSCISAS